MSDNTACPVLGCTTKNIADLYDHLPDVHGAVGVRTLANVARRLAAVDAAVLEVMDRVKAYVGQGGEIFLFRLLSDLAVARGLGRAPEHNTWADSATRTTTAQEK